eukprot:3100192-Rhodomonas_salina.1
MKTPNAVQGSFNDRGLCTRSRLNKSARTSNAFGALAVQLVPGRLLSRWLTISSTTTSITVLAWPGTGMQTSDSLPFRVDEPCYLARSPAFFVKKEEHAVDGMIRVPEPGYGIAVVLCRNS